jgi:hypothetical protein
MRESVVQEPLPGFPITWHAYGVVVEASWPEIRLDLNTIRASVFGDSTPEWTLCEADAMAMAEEVRYAASLSSDLGL